MQEETIRRREKRKANMGFHKKIGDLRWFRHLFRNLHLPDLLALSLTRFSKKSVQLDISFNIDEFLSTIRNFPVAIFYSDASIQLSFINSYFPLTA